MTTSLTRNPPRGPAGSAGLITIISYQLSKAKSNEETNISLWGSEQIRVKLISSYIVPIFLQQAKICIGGDY